VESLAKDLDWHRSCPESKLLKYDGFLHIGLHRQVHPDRNCADRDARPHYCEASSKNGPGFLYKWLVLAANARDNF
jgi:hypothetical protein